MIDRCSKVKMTLIDYFFLVTEIDQSMIHIHVPAHKGKFSMASKFHFKSNWLLKSVSASRELYLTLQSCHNLAVSKILTSFSLPPFEIYDDGPHSDNVETNKEDRELPCIQLYPC